MAVADGVDDEKTLAFGPRAQEFGADRFGAPFDHAERDQADFTLHLTLQHADEIGVAHRRQRMVFHRAVGQQHPPDEEVTEIDRSAVGGEGRAGDRQIGVQDVEQRLGDRADVARVGRVERRAIFEQELLGAGRSQRRGGGERHRDGVRRGDGARLQGDHHSVGPAEL